MAIITVPNVTQGQELRPTDTSADVYVADKVLFSLGSIHFTQRALVAAVAGVIACAALKG